MIGILAFTIFFIWLYYYRKEQNYLKSQAYEANDGPEPDEGSREDYLRAYQSESQRQPYGNWENFDGRGGSLRPW